MVFIFVFQHRQCFSNGNKQVYLCNIIRYSSGFSMIESCFVNYSFYHFALCCLIHYNNTETFLILITQIQLSKEFVR